MQHEARKPEGGVGGRGWLLTTVARPGLLTAAGFGRRRRRRRRPAGCGGSSMWEEVPLEWV